MIAGRAASRKPWPAAARTQVVARRALVVVTHCIVMLMVDRAQRWSKRRVQGRHQRATPADSDWKLRFKMGRGACLCGR